MRNQDGNRVVVVIVGSWSAMTTNINHVRIGRNVRIRRSEGHSTDREAERGAESQA